MNVLGALFFQRYVLFFNVWFISSTETKKKRNCLVILKMDLLKEFIGSQVHRNAALGMAITGAFIGGGGALLGSFMESKEDPNDVSVRLELTHLSYERDVCESINELQRLIQLSGDACTWKIMENIAVAFNSLLQIEMQAEGEAEMLLSSNYESQMLLNVISRSVDAILSRKAEIPALHEDIACICEHLREMASDSVHNIHQMVSEKWMKGNF